MWHNASTMDYDPSGKRGWEAITHLSFDEQIRITFDADTAGFIRGVTEIIHKHPVNAMGALYARTLPLERINNVAGTENSLNEQVNSQHRHGWLELSHTRSLQNTGYEEIAFEEVVVRQHVSGSSHPEWFRGAVRNALEEFDPTEEEVAEFRTKWLEALVKDNARKKRVTGGRAIEATNIEIRGGFL